MNCAHFNVPQCVCCITGPDCLIDIFNNSIQYAIDGNIYIESMCIRLPKHTAYLKIAVDNYHPQYMNMLNALLLLS